MADDTNIVNFRSRQQGGPSVPPPPLPPGLPPAAPAAPSAPAPEEAPEPDAAPAEPRLPVPAEMAPPLHLTMPGVPGGQDDEEGPEGEFVPPGAADPENPGPRDTMAVALALMTALGIAGARSLWQAAELRRQKLRQARAQADAARAAADKAAARKAAATSSPTSATSASRPSKSSGGTGSSKPLLSGGRTSPSAARTSGSGSRTGTAAGKGPGKSKEGSSGSHSASKPGPWARIREARARRAATKAAEATQAIKAAKKAAKKAKNAEGAKAVEGTAEQAATGKVRWRDRGKAGLGHLRERVRAARAVRAQKRAEAGEAQPDTPDLDTPVAKRRWSWRPWKRSTEEGQEQAAPAEAAEEKAEDAGDVGPQEQPSARREEPTPPPPPGWEWMRPPPAADPTVHITVERVDAEQPQARPEAAAIKAARPALGAAAPSVPPQRGARFVSTPVKSTQFGDAELTVYDVIDADADAAEEIMDGAVAAAATAEGCDRLYAKLEAIAAEVADLKVPGVLAGMLALLMDKTQSVKAKAEAIAATLPMAAEAVATAGTNAAARHQSLADAVRDAGHTRPAEREYHEE